MKLERIVGSNPNTLLGSNTIRIYLKYSVLQLAEYRALLGDFESVYRGFDSERLQEEMAPSFGRVRRFPLRVEQINTGRSIETILTGHPEVIAMVGQLLGAIHSYWVQVSLSGGTALGAIRLRKSWYEGSKAKAEARKANAEAAKIEDETKRFAAGNLAGVAPAGEIAGESAPFGEHELAAGKLVKRIDRVRRSPRIEQMEIDVDGQKFLVSGQRSRFLIERIEPTREEE